MRLWSHRTELSGCYEITRSSLSTRHPGIDNEVAIDTDQSVATMTPTSVLSKYLIGLGRSIISLRLGGLGVRTFDPHKVRLGVRN